MRTGRLVVRLMAVAALVLGIVVMHHVARSDHDEAGGHEYAAMTAASDESVEYTVLPNPSADGVAADTEGGAASAHGLLHLCLAVLTAAAIMLVGWLLLALRPWATTSPLAVFRAWPVPARAPPRPYGSALLMSLCLMRT